RAYACRSVMDPWQRVSNLPHVLSPDPPRIAAGQLYFTPPLRRRGHHQLRLRSDQRQHREVGTRAAADSERALDRDRVPDIHDDGSRVGRRRLRGRFGRRRNLHLNRGARRWDSDGDFRARNHQPLAWMNQFGCESIGLLEDRYSDSKSPGNRVQRIAAADDVPVGHLLRDQRSLSRQLGCLFRGGFRRFCCLVPGSPGSSRWNSQDLPGMDACRIAQAIVRGQRADGDAVAQGNAVEGFAWLNDVGTTGLYPFGCAQDEESDGGKHERYNKDPAHGTTTMPASSIAPDTRKRTEAAPFRITASPLQNETASFWANVSSTGTPFERVCGRTSCAPSCADRASAAHPYE